MLRAAPNKLVAEQEPRVGIPEVTYHHIQLPKTNLHYIRCGDGPPLVMVPATISKIENWVALAQFLGQRFTVYFFELPGHGQSTPFPEPFSSAQVAETVEALINQLGHDKVSLMGFSFGGILAMTALARLQSRVEKVILLSPMLTKRALAFSKLRVATLKAVVGLLKRPRVRKGFLQLVHSPRFTRLLAASVRQIGKVENSISMSDVFQKLSDTTTEVLCYQMSESLDFEPQMQPAPFGMPCYFAMSVADPLLNFDTTLTIANKYFSQVYVDMFNFPYHQPPKALTFEELNLHYSRLLEQAASN